MGHSPCLYLAADDNRPADIQHLQSLVALQLDGQCNHTLRALWKRSHSSSPLVTGQGHSSVWGWGGHRTRSQEASSSSFKLLFTCSMLARCVPPSSPILLPDSLRAIKVQLDCGERERISTGNTKTGVCQTGSLKHCVSVCKPAGSLQEQRRPLPRCH